MSLSEDTIIRTIRTAPTVQADRPSKADKDGMDMEQAKEYCKACQHNEVCRYYPYDGCQFKDTDRPHGEWKATADDVRGICVCGADIRRKQNV